MIHLAKYKCAVTDNLKFRGVPTRGSTFHCKACNKHAFQIPGELDEGGGSDQPFIKSLKARHAEHVKKCTPGAPEPPAAPTEKPETATEVAAPSPFKEGPDLESGDIRRWKDWQVNAHIRKHGHLPASVELFRGDAKRWGTSEWFECRLYNEHGAVDMLLHKRILSELPKSLIWSKTPVLCERVNEDHATFLERRRVAIINECVSAAIKSVLQKGRARHFRSAKGKLERVLTEMYRLPHRHRRPRLHRRHMPRLRHHRPLCMRSSTHT